MLSFRFLQLPVGLKSTFPSGGQTDRQTLTFNSPCDHFLCVGGGEEEKVVAHHFKSRSNKDELQLGLLWAVLPSRACGDGDVCVLALQL